MHHLISPNILNENSYEYLLNQLPPLDTHEKDINIDLSITESIDHYSILATLELGIYLTRNSLSTSISLPKNNEVLQCMANCGFFKVMSLGFPNHTGTLPQADSDKGIILEITPVEKSLDIHDITQAIRSKIKQKYNEQETYLWDNVLVVVSEICQNIPEHSQDRGFVAMQEVFHKQYKKNYINIVVMDSGIGIKHSLDKKFSAVFRAQWSDHMALHKTLFEGVSRHDDPGRGNGIIRTREMVVEKYRGNMSVRSGTAKLWGKIATWEIERFFRRPLTYLPGTQVNLLLPLQ